MADEEVIYLNNLIMKCLSRIGERFSSNLSAFDHGLEQRDLSGMTHPPLALAVRFLGSDYVCVLCSMREKEMRVLIAKCRSRSIRARQHGTFATKSSSFMPAATW